MKNLIPVADRFSKRLRIPRTHFETGIHRKERESQRSIEGINKDFFVIHAEAREEFHLPSSYWIEKFYFASREKIHPFFSRRYIIERNSSEKKHDDAGAGIGDKPEHLSVITNSIVFWHCRERTGILHLFLQLYEKNRSDVKVSRKLWHFVYLETNGSICCLVSQTQRICETKHSSSKLEESGDSECGSEVRTWEERSIGNS